MKKKSFVYGVFSFLFLALIVFFMFGSLQVPILSDLGDKILGKQQQDVKGIEENKEVIDEDIVGEEQVVETELPEELEEDTGTIEKPTTEKTSTVSKPKTDESTVKDLPKEIVPTNNVPIQEEQIDYCKESNILEYRQIIATSESSIKYNEAFLADPKNDYDYTYKYNQCEWTYYDCMDAADEYFLQVTGWTYLESGSYGCSHVASCAGALKTRTEMMNICYSNLHQCRTDVDAWLNDKILEANQQIDQRKGLIIENQNKLASCGL